MTKLGPWPIYPKVKATQALSLIYPIPLHSDLCPDPAAILENLKEWRVFLEARELPYEVIVIPYGDESIEFSKDFEEVELYVNESPVFHLHLHLHLATRAQAVRAGFLLSLGALLLFADIEQPCGFEFFSEAISHSKVGFEFVRANRRIAGAHFRTPVRLLPYIYRRHSLSVLHNWILKKFFPVKSTDVQSTNYVVRRELAFEIFTVQGATDMTFEIEAALVASLQNARSIDLPVQTRMSEEKSNRRLLREMFLMARSFFKLLFRYRRGYYERFQLNHAVSADDWGLSIGVNRGILALARQGVVKRVALMATEDFLEMGLKDLQAVAGVELGLHFNLTHGYAQQFGHGSPGKFLVAWMKNRAAYKLLVRDELVKQIERLHRAGVCPTYLDGHHHMHLAPGLIEDVADILKKYGIKDIRLPYDPALTLSSKAILNFLSMWARPAFDRLGFHARKCFYPQREDFLDQAKLRSKLARTEKYEVIVHPADRDDVRHLQQPDHYSADRVLEFCALRMLKIDPAIDRSQSH